MRVATWFCNRQEFNCRHCHHDQESTMNTFSTAVLPRLSGSRLELLGVAGLRLIATWLAAYREWRLVSRSRKELAQLDDYQLRDIGLSRSQALFESGKTFFER
jgi:uncharacterized protein YjiS (DUF1127 family)